MTPDKLNTLAREAGISLNHDGMMRGPHYGPVHPKYLARFAALVRADALKAPRDALEWIAAQSSGIPASTAKADCMAAIAVLAIRALAKQEVGSE